MASEKKQRGMGGSAAKEDVPKSMLRLPERLKAARVSRDWSQDELAEAAGVSQTTVTNLERGDSLEGVRLQMVVRLAEALKISLDELVLGTPDPWPQIAKAVADGKVSQIAVVQSAPALEPAPAPAEPSSKPGKRRQRPRQ